MAAVPLRSGCRGMEEEHVASTRCQKTKSGSRDADVGSLLNPTPMLDADVGKHSAKSRGGGNDADEVDDIGDDGDDDDDNVAA